MNLKIVKNSWLSVLMRILQFLLCIISLKKEYDMYIYSSRLISQKIKLLRQKVIVWYYYHREYQHLLESLGLMSPLLLVLLKTYYLYAYHYLQLCYYYWELAITWASLHNFKMRILIHCFWYMNLLLEDNLKGRST